jgi:hypothetical protein
LITGEISNPTYIDIWKNREDLLALLGQRTLTTLDNTLVRKANVIQE